MKPESNCFKKEWKLISNYIEIWNLQIHLLKLFLHIFDHCIKAIVLYGCENWGVFNITQKRKTLLLFNIFKEWEMEKLNLKYRKHILGVTKLCTNIAVLSELGRYPLYIDLFMLKQLFMYWYYRLEDSPFDLLSRAYNEYKSSNNQSNNSWYINLLFFQWKTKY
jgi:hypothetical protein